MSVRAAVFASLAKACRRRGAALAALVAIALTVASGFAHSASENGVREGAFRFSRAVQQHLSTGFPLRGAHEVTRCESCHVRGVFKGTPKDCATCHGPGARISSVTMTPGHPVVAQPCTVCHNQISFTNIKFDHTNAMPGSCASCHNGMQASGKPAGHVVTTQSCDTCHKTTLWAGATFDHTSVRAGTCATCHNGTKATGKPATHVPTSASCDSCHQVVAWKTARFNHAGVTGGSCASCHNGASATGMPANHVPVKGSCDACHSTSTFAGTAMNHAGIASGCAACHDSGRSFFGVTMKTPPPNHVPATGAACEACHAPANFAAFGPNTPMNHAPVTGTACATCHETGKSFFGVTMVTRPTAAKDPKHPTSGDCGTCHTTMSFAVAAAKPANHIPTTQGCALCHANLSTYKPGVMNHAGIGSGCTVCHAAAPSGIAFVGVTPVSQGSGHIPTAADCATCHKSTSAFGPGTAMVHAGISSGCATCHETGKSFVGVTNLKTKPSNHIPTSAACESCHAAGNFTSFGGTPMNHAPVAGTACATCHETGRSFFGVTIVTRPTPAADPAHPPTGDCGTCHTTSSFAVAGGKPANHIPTTAACTLCHTNPSSYKPGVMNHTGISSGCTTCHAVGATGTPFYGVTPKPQGAGHIPTSSDCAMCHKSTTAFGPGTLMVHTGITTGCATCHDTGKSFTGVTNLKTKPSNHVPTSAACETCHSATNFTTFAGTAMNHSGIASGCTTCHAASVTGTPFAGVTPVPQGKGHVPTAADCTQCHKSTSAFGPGTAMNHAPVAGTPCATCHETGKSFYGVTIVTRPTPAADPNHPPTGDCGGCHSSTTSFSTGVSGGKPANHVPTTAACTLCHTNPSSYKPGVMNHSGISSGCTTCHAVGATGTPFYGVTPKPQGSGHIPTSSDCAVCHKSTTAFGPGTAMAHTGIKTGCATCHDTGKSFTGVTNLKTKPPNHVPTSAACETCHSASNFTTFAGTTMNHSGIASGCQACHAASVTGTPFAGVTPKPQGTGHIPTSSDCAMCHKSTTAFGPGTAMVHTGISSGCASCHDTSKRFTGITNLKTKPSNHIPTSATCETCHSATNFTTFAGTAMNHSGIASGCTTCHAASVTGTPFAGVTPKPQGTGHIPTTADCTLCHKSTTAFGPGTAMNHAPVAGTPCATCHETGKSFYGVTIVTRPTPAADPNHPLTGDCGGCHSSTTSFSTGVSGGKPANHIPTTQACTLCHTNPSSYKPGVMNHTGISSGCTTCHAVGATGTPFYGVTPKPQGTGHIPTSSDCAMCHKSTTAFGPGTLMVHTGITSGCATCHDTGKSFTGVTNLKTKPSNHVPTSATCETCHSASNFTTFAGTAMNHSGIASGCTTCHAASVTGTPFAGVTPKPQGSGPHPDHGGLRDVSQVHHGVRSWDGNGAHGHHQRMRDLPRDGEELLRRDDRDTADACGRSESPIDRRLQRLPHLHDLVQYGSQRRQAGEPHSDRGRLHICVTPIRRRTSLG